MIRDKYSTINNEPNTSIKKRTHNSNEKLITLDYKWGRYWDNYRGICLLTSIVNRGETDIEYFVEIEPEAKIV